MPSEAPPAASAKSKRNMKNPPEVKKLIAKGKEKGFVTYDEVNDSLPEDISSANDIDDLQKVNASTGAVVDGSSVTTRFSRHLVRDTTGWKISTSAVC